MTELDLPDIKEIREKTEATYQKRIVGKKVSIISAINGAAENGLRYVNISIERPLAPYIKNWINASKYDLLISDNPNDMVVDYTISW